MVTVALMMGGDGGAVTEWVGLQLRVRRLSIERSWVQNPSGKTLCLKSLGMRLVCPKRIAVEVYTKWGRRHCNVKAFPRWRLVSNSSSATIHHLALHSLNHSRQVEALNKISTFKNKTLASCPLPPYALYEYINVDYCERPLI